MLSAFLSHQLHFNVLQYLVKLAGGAFKKNFLQPTQKLCTQDDTCIISSIKCTPVVCNTDLDIFFLNKTQFCITCRKYTSFSFQKLIKQIVNVDPTNTLKSAYYRNPLKL